MSDTKQLEDGTVVKRTLMLGDPNGPKVVTFTAWEPSEIAGSHGTITTIAGRWYGKIGTDPDPALFEHLVGASDERCVAVAAAYEARYQVAYTAIVRAFPEVADGGVRSDGEITVRYMS